MQFNYLRKLQDKWYFGGFYHFDNYRIAAIALNGILDNGFLIGEEGSVISRLGLLARYDNRDNIFHPSEGIFSTLELEKMSMDN